jgi:membrane-associated HD superfamily phosphohydrolase
MTKKLSGNNLVVKKMEIVYLSIILCVVFAVITVFLAVKRNKSKVPKHKRELKTWMIVTISLAVLSFVMIFLGWHQHLIVRGNKKVPHLGRHVN